GDFNFVAIFDTATNTLLDHAGGMGQPTHDGLAITPDGNFLAVTNWQDDTVSIVDTTVEHAIATVPVGSGPVGVAFTPGFRPSPTPGPAPGVTIDQVLAFFDQSVANGRLVGQGRGAWPRANIQALRAMLIAARGLFKRGNLAAAARQLQAVALRTD